MPLRFVRRFFVLAALALAAPRLGGQDAETLRERARAAAGPWPAAGMSAVMSLEGRGQAQASGTEGALRLLLSPTGAFRSEFDSALPEQAGFDGARSWTRDRTGLARVVQLEEADQRKLFHWVLAGRWTEARELEVTAIAGEPTSLRLRLVGTPMEMTLRLDPESALPAELVQAGDAGPRRWTFADFRAPEGAGEGRRLPHRWSYHEDGREERTTITSYRPVASDAAAFRTALGTPRDVRFSSEVPAELEVTRMTSGHLLVQPLLEGESMGAFILDTGAGITVIDSRVADELFLETLGSTVAVGVAGSTTSAYRRGERFQLGPLTIEGPIYGDLDLSFLQPAMGPRIAGIAGFDLLARCVLEIEPATPRVALFDPAHHTLAQGTWQELLLHQNHACVRARFEGEREGLFRLDTGAGGSVTFHAPAVRALGLLTGRELSAGRSGGVGGRASAPEGTLAWFELAGQRFDEPRVSFSEASTGAFTDAYTTGNIGQGFLRSFRIVLDYPHDRLALVPLPR